MKLGIIIIVFSIVWYIAHTIIYNYFLQKHNPGIFDNVPEQKRKKGKKQEVHVVITSGQTPAWVMLMGMLPIPLFILGVLITIIGFIISLFN